MGVVAVLDIWLGAKVEGFEAGIHKAIGVLEKFTGLVEGKATLKGFLEGIGLGKLGEFAAGVFAAGVALNEFAQHQFEAILTNVRLAERLGVTGEELKVMRLAAQETGSDVEALVKGSERFSVAISTAQGGAVTAAQAMDELGLSADELAGKSKVQQMRDLGAALQEASQKFNTGDIDKLSKALLGKGFAESKRALKELGENYEELLAKGKELSPPLPEGAADLIRDAVIASEEVDTAWNSIKNTLALELAGPLTAITGWFRDLFVWVNKLLRSTSDWLRMLTGQEAWYTPEREREEKQAEAAKKSLQGANTTMDAHAADQGSKEAFQIIAESRRVNPIVDKLQEIKDAIEKQTDIVDQQEGSGDFEGAGAGGDF